MERLQQVIDSVYKIEYTKDATELLVEEVNKIKSYIKVNHFTRSSLYLDCVNNILNDIDNLSKLSDGYLDLRNI